MPVSYPCLEADGLLPELHVVDDPAARVAELVAHGVGKPFSPSAGRLMKGWIEVTHAKADWVSLAKEAQRIATENALVAAKKKAKR